MTDDPGAVLADTLAAERVPILASLFRLTSDIEIAEDALQEAATRALVHWPSGGCPRVPQRG